MYSLDSIFKNIREIISTVVIKYDSKGKKHETLEISRAHDIYTLALEEKDTFYIYSSFDERSLRYAGITDEDEIYACINDKNNIPSHKRDAVVAYQRYITINEHEEKNNYYRMLNGKPDIEDTDYIYIDIGVASELEIDYTTPIHKLSDDEILRIEYVGELKRLQTLYDKPYLQYLGSNKIDITIARQARNFSILRMSTNTTDSFYYEFQRIYGQCREYVMSVFYIKEHSQRYEKYDNFIAMVIMVMSIQRMFVNTFKYGIDRDFYDIGSIKLLFDSYNVPFIEDIPISYQRILMKNLNNLLRYKSSDKVLYDICDILGFSNINIYKYFLSKEHIKDDEGNPVFIYKDIEDPITHEITQVYDSEKMFDLKWKAVELRERDVASALLETTNTETYESVINDDPLWVDDSDLRERLYESEFNYIESKYLKMNIMYNLTSVLFDTIHIFRMLADKKSETQEFSITLPKILGDKEVPIFNAVIFLTTLICKKNNLKGNIITSPSQTLHVLGFNFSADFSEVRKFIKENSKWIDQDIILYFDEVTFTTPSDINKCYSNIKSLHKYLCDAMRHAKTKKEYDVHKKLYDTLLITEASKEIYTKSDGEVALTYLELLQDIDVDLYAAVTGTEIDDIVDVIEHVILQFSSFIDYLDSFYYLSADNNVLLNALIKLVDFFKSYTTDLTTFNILYSYNDVVGHMIKNICHIEYIDKYTDYSMYNMLLDEATIKINQMDKEDIQILIDKLEYIGTFINHSDLYEFNETTNISKVFTGMDVIYKLFSDLLYSAKAELQHRDPITMVDTIKIIYET